MVDNVDAGQMTLASKLESNKKTQMIQERSYHRQTFEWTTTIQFWQQTASHFASVTGITAKIVIPCPMPIAGNIKHTTNSVVRPVSFLYCHMVLTVE